MKTKLLILCLFLGILAANSQVPTKGLVLYLPLNGNANDSTSYANNGTNHGATPVTDRFGKQKKAMYFNGSSYINIPSNSTLNLNRNKSLASWIFLPISEVQNWYPTIIHKDEPTMSTTYSLELADYYGYGSLQHKVSFLYASGTTHYQAFSKQLYTNYQAQWIHIVGTYDSISGYNKMYFNGVLSDSTYVGNRLANSSSNDLYIGCGKPYAYNYSQTFFKGYIDDVRLYNRPLTKDEVMNLFLEGKLCSNLTRNDTTTYYINSEAFKSISPQFQLIKTDSLKTKVGGCDSIIKHYNKFEYSIATGISVASNKLNSIKIFPNPAKDYVTISITDYLKMNGYSMVIQNILGKTVYSASVVQEVTNLVTKNWSGSGIYFIQLFDNQNVLIDTRKIIVK